MKYLSVIIVLMLCASPARMFAQSQSLESVEKGLMTLAYDILTHESLDHKIAQNKEFTRKLMDVLNRPESFSYPFDSLRTISRLTAEDKSFRIFTWHIVDRNKAEIRGEHYHYYFGLVQRNYVNPAGKTEMIVIPLLEIPRIPGGIENMQLDNENWLGAQYYPLKNHQTTIPKYTLKSKPIKARRDSIYVLGQGWNPKNNKTRKQDLYLLLGWNGNDDQTNYKIAEVMSFDQDDPKRVIFGASAFYFDRFTSKQRAVFKYSDNAPFTMNMAYVKTGRTKRKEMIVYDHMGIPKMARANPKAIWDLGPDGSYDALAFSKKYGGFKWFKNVELAEVLNKRLIKESEDNQEKILRARLAELKRIAQLMEDDELVQELTRLEQKTKLSNRTLTYMRKREKEIVKNQEELSKKEKERLKAAGIILPEPEKEKEK